MFTEDLDQFLADFGVTVTYRPTIGASAPITVIWDEPGSTLSFRDQTMITEETTARAKSSDLTSIKNGAVLVKDAVVHYVRNHQKDGTGFTVLTLSDR